MSEESSCREHHREHVSAGRVDSIRRAYPRLMPPPRGCDSSKRVCKAPFWGGGIPKQDPVRHSIARFEVYPHAKNATRSSKIKLRTDPRRRATVGASRWRGTAPPAICENPVSTWHEAILAHLGMSIPTRMGRLTRGREGLVL